MYTNIQFSIISRFNRYKIILIGSLFILIGCKKSALERNPYLYEAAFDQTINLALPVNDNLNYQGGSMYLSRGGIKGLLLFNLAGTIMAWEASCPNHAPNNCSTTIINGVTSSCPCEDFQYSLATGQPLTGGAAFSLLFYNVQQSGTTIRISN